MYVIVAELKVKPDQAERFGRLVDGQAKESVELEEQCRQFDVCQAEGDLSHFLLYEIYDDRAAFDKHRQMAHTRWFLAEVSRPRCLRNQGGSSVGTFAKAIRNA